MTVITVPVSAEHDSFIKSLVKSGRAANKAHAVRMGIQLLKEEDAIQSILRSQEDVRAGRVFKGDLDELAKQID